MKQIFIQRIQADEQLLLQPSAEAGRDEFKVLDDGKGNIDIKVGTSQVGWFNMASGFLICDPSKVLTADPRPEASSNYVPPGLPTPVKRP